MKIDDGEKIKTGAKRRHKYNQKKKIKKKKEEEAEKTMHAGLRVKNKKVTPTITRKSQQQQR